MNAPLRIMTAGSVDDGKSTLIGRLMFDLNLMTDDILDDLRAASRRNGRGDLDLSLFTDGLLAEREQGITIDVAYRYFNHQGRPFVLCDSPGHVQYTRNMVCAASQADVALIMVDARQGPTEQSLRHLRIAQWLRVPSIVFLINKMDLIEFSQARFDSIVDGLRGKLSLPASEFSSGTTQNHFEFIPVVALDGDNLVKRSSSPERLGWYTGPTLIDVIENTTAQAAFPLAAPFRFTVQMVLRPTGKEAGDLHDFRGLAGRVEAGEVRPGDRVKAVSPEGIERESTILGIHRFESGQLQSLNLAQAGQSITLTLKDDIDVSRGDTLSPAIQASALSRNLETQVCWMSESPAKLGQRILVKQGARSSLAKISSIGHKLNLEQGQFVASSGADESTLQLNEIASVGISFAQHMLQDRYEESPRTGSLLILDASTFDTLAAGLVT